MGLVRVHEDMVEISHGDAKWRIERGPKKKVAAATEELLSDAVTATHYHVGGKDAVGKKIVLGEEMTYLDWLGERNWKVFRLHADQGPNAWEPIGEKDTDVDAIAFAYSAMIEEAGK